MRDLRGLSAVVTGGSSGIGFALARTLLEEGARVSISGTDAPKLQIASKALSAAGGEVFAQVADVASESAMDRFAASVLDRYGAVNLLCCNAGVNCLRPIVEMNMDDWNWVMNTNLGGTFNTLRAFLPGMLRQPTARHVLYTGSMSSLNSPRVVGLSAYTAAKMGMLGLSAVLEDEVGLDALGQTFAFIGSAESDMSASALRRRPGRSMARPSDKARGVKRISAQQASRIMIDGVKAGRRFVASHGDLAQDFIPFQDAQRAAFRFASQAS